MKRLLCVVLVLAAGAVSLAQAPTQPLVRKKRVAVLDFDYATVRSNVTTIFGSDVDVGKGITNMLVTSLVKDATYSVIERQALDKILAEQNFSASDRANPATAAKFGKLLAVDAIVVGSITQFGNDTRNQGGAGGIGLGAIGIRRAETTAAVVLDARIVNVDTGEITAVANGKGESKRRSTMLGDDWRGFGNAEMDFSRSDFQKTMLGEAIRGAVNQISVQVIAGNAKIEARKISVEGLVAAVENGLVILNVGAKAGVKVGDRLSVERVAREIRDPATNQVIRRMTSSVGVIEITEVDDISSVAKTISGSGFNVGDVAKSVTN